MHKKKDMSPFYRRLLADAWNIAWMHKHLWVFGFFATIVGFGGVTEVFFHAYDKASETLPVAMTQAAMFAGLPGGDTVRLIASYAPYPVVILVLFGVIGVLLAVVFVWMTTVSIGALAAGTRKISRGGEPNFGDLVKVGSESFWKLFAINVTARVVIFLSLFITSINLFSLMMDRGGVSEFFYFCSFVVFTAISFVASLTAVLGSISLMARGGNAERAVVDALTIIRDHWLVCFETAILLLITNVVVGVAAAIIAVILCVPFIFLIVIAAVLKASGAIFALITLTGAFLVAAVVLLGSFLTTFETAAWTLLWNDLSNRNAAGILMRWMDHWFKPKK
jgi:hypothetical protein